MTSVEQLKSGTNYLTPDGTTLQLFHTSQITIIMDPADEKRGCMLIRACTLNRWNMVNEFLTYLECPIRCCLPQLCAHLCLPRPVLSLGAKLPTAFFGSLQKISVLYKNKLFKETKTRQNTTWHSLTTVLYYLLIKYNANSKPKH